MLLHHDVVAHREPEACSLAGRLGREERVEHPVLDVSGNANAVVTDANFDGFAKTARLRTQRRFESAAMLAETLRDRIETVGD